MKSDLDKLLKITLNELEMMPEQSSEVNMDEETKINSVTPKRRLIRVTDKPFRPIILSLLVLISIMPCMLRAQFEGTLSISTHYSDNVFQLSDYDLQRFDDGNPALSFAKTSDDLSLQAKIDLAYPLQYKWWTITPSISATLGQNVKNTDKSRRDAIGRLRVDRYYWNFTALYGFYPYTYLRDYTDSDGTGDLEKFSYEKDLYRADLNIKPFKNTTIKLHGKYEVYCYNEYFTEFDSDAYTLGASIKHNFPIFSLETGYYYKVLDNSDNQVDPLEDASYESNEYTAGINMKKMPMDDSKPRGAKWWPSFDLSYQERFFQGTDEWYGGRADKIYSLNAGIGIDLSKSWNINLDYSHIFRNVESPNSSVRRSKEYGENRLRMVLNYSF